MTDHPQEPQPGDDRPRTLIVPGARERIAHDEEPVSDAQQMRDLGSASRSCVAIIVMLLVIALVLCVFLTWALLIR